jgi:hypothetical protein
MPGTVLCLLAHYFESSGFRGYAQLLDENKVQQICYTQHIQDLRVRAYCNVQDVRMLYLMSTSYTWQSDGQTPSKCNIMTDNGSKNSAILKSSFR